MRRLALLVATAALAAVCAAPGVAHATQVDDTCAQASPTDAVCVGVDKLTEAGAAECRRAGVPDGNCNPVAGHQWTEADLRNYQGSWLHRAAQFQYALGSSVPLVQAQWLGTHNSFNSVNDTPTASHTDSNQQLSLPQQLDIDMRALEIDVHYVLNPSAGGYAVTVCHGLSPSQANFGCTNEPTLRQVLPQIDGWLNAHSNQVILLYLEDELGNPQGYTDTVNQLEAALRAPDGHSLIYHPGAVPAGHSCVNMPLGATRAGILASGAQVMVVGNCRPGWSSEVFGWDANHVESGSTPGYKPFPTCDATYSRSVYDSELVRYFEDSTWVSQATNPTQTPAQAQANMLTPARVTMMTDCGVNLFGFDQILPDDGRIQASIWSWAPDEPDAARGSCTVQRADGRWQTRPCTSGERHPAACLTPAGTWTLSAPTTWAGAGTACSSAGGAAFGLPRTGYQNTTLRQAAGSSAVWVDYRLPRPRAPRRHR